MVKRQMTNEPLKKNKRRMSLLTGASLFLALVVYFNFRSDKAMTVVDWAVIGVGAVFFVFALLKYFKERKTSGVG